MNIPHMMHNVICSRPEVNDDVISGQDLKTLGAGSAAYPRVDFEVATFSNFKDNRLQRLSPE